MKKVKIYNFILMTIGLSLVVWGSGCGKNNETLSSTDIRWTEDVQFKDFASISSSVASNDNINQSPGNNQDTDSIGDFFADIDDIQFVQIEGTQRQLLILRSDLNANLNDLPDTGVNVEWIQRTEADNKDVTFSGEHLLVQKSLVTDIKQAIDSASGIPQATIDAKKIQKLFSFSFVFHYTENGYWKVTEAEEKDLESFDIVEGVSVSETGGSLSGIMVSQSHLNMASDDLPDQVKIILFHFDGSIDLLNQDSLSFGFEILTVPKSVIVEVQSKMANSGTPQPIARDNETWTSLATIEMEIFGLL